MVEKRQDGRLVVKGRVDANNAQIFEKELLGLCDPDKEVHIDVDGLEYISSAGLRVFMKLKKQTGKEVVVENVSSDIYDILQVTGFTEILTVEKKLRELSVEGCELVGEGANGKVYRLDDETIVKVFTPGVPMGRHLSPVSRRPFPMMWQRSVTVTARYMKCCMLKLFLQS